MGKCIYEVVWDIYEVNGCIYWLLGPGEGGNDIFGCVEIVAYFGVGNWILCHGFINEIVTFLQLVSIKIKSLYTLSREVVIRGSHRILIIVSDRL